MNFLTKNLFPIFFLSMLSFIILYIGGFDSLVSLWISLTIYGGIFYIFNTIWRKIRSKTALHIQDFFGMFLKKISIGISVSIALIAGFCYYQNVVNPAEMPLYTLTNGAKQLRFQTMSHIGSQSFYDGVKSEIATAKQDDFILFYEGVRPGSPESIDGFNEAIGIDFNPKLYENFSKLYGVEHQKNPEFLGISNNKDYNIDLDIDTIMAIYDKKIGKSQDMPEDSMERNEKRVADIGSDIIDQLSGLSEKELAIMRYMNKSILNFIIKNDSFRNMIISKVGNQDLFAVILDDRNAHLVENIISSEEENIFIIYGLMHFDGVLHLLQEADSAWKIQTVEYKKLID